MRPRSAWFVFVLLLVGCDRRYAHAKCVQSKTAETCSTCCVDEGFDTDVAFSDADEFSNPDCYCLFEVE